MSHAVVLARRVRTALLAFAFFGSFTAGAQIAIPPLTARVTDQTATLTVEQKAELEQTLQTFEARKGSQIVVHIVATTAPETIEQYALRVAEQWKPGRKKIDDGVILVVAKDDRALRIEVGYGLEGALTDAASKRIISEIIAPRFRQGDFHGGIRAGIDQIMRVIDGEPLPPPGKPSGDFSGLQSYAPIIFMVALVMGGVLRALLGRLLGALVTGGAVAVVAWFVVGALSIALGAGILAFLFTLLGGGMGGFGSGGHRGGSGGFGTGGGGFSGGGGGFGGGGASGRW